MTQLIFKLYYVGLLTILLAYGSSIAAKTQLDINSIAYWRANYQELQPQDDSRVHRAHKIFERLIQVAGRRPDVAPKLFIINADHSAPQLPIALPQGWIVLSKQVLDICYREPTTGDDRLAFILGHELSHQLSDDVRHLLLFQGGADNRLPTGISNNVQNAFSPTMHKLVREIRADERGIIYAVMAGFDARAIMTEDDRVNFFVDWVRALNPGLHSQQMHPELQKRTVQLKNHLWRVVDQTAIFQAGLWWYYAGDYPQAIQAFSHFNNIFPGREVSHNLATSHHRLALQMYQVWKPNQPPIPFLMSMSIDPETRASKLYHHHWTARRRSQEEPVDTQILFRQHLDEAIQHYNKALELDTAYVAAARNLGNALIVRGEQGHRTRADRQADVEQAVIKLKNVLEYHATDAAILTNLGVASYYQDQRDQAKMYLDQARRFAADDAAPVCNLKHIARMEGKKKQAQQYSHQCQKLLNAHTSPPSKTYSTSMETIQELVVGGRVPSHWQTGKRSTFELHGNIYYRLETYEPGLTTLTRSGRVVMAMAHRGYPGVSARGIRLGNQGRDVLKRYGPPSRRLSTTEGQSWSYDAQGIAFQLKHHRVVSWLIYPETYNE